MSETRDEVMPSGRYPHPLGQALAERPLLVVGLCAAWCNTCAEFQAAFDRLADARADATFVWLDIEDDADVAGDIDVDNFPTIAVFLHGRLVHFGVSLPQAGIVTRLLDAIDGSTRTFDADAGVTGLPARLAAISPDAARRAWRGP